MKRAGVLLSLAAVLSAAAYLMGSPAAALMAVGIMAHYALARLSFEPSVRVERTVPERGTEREPVKARIKVENLSGVTGVLRIRETSKSVFARELKTFLNPGDKKYLEQTIVPQAKGRIAIKAEATFEDERGLFKKDFPVIEHGEMTIFPSPRSIKEAMRERRQVEALAEVERALGIGAETLDFEELREFLPGDDITKIDWKATSRLNTLIVRVFRRESLADVYLLVNVDRKFRRELKAGKIDYLVLIIAQLFTYFRRFGHSVKVVAYDEAGIVRVIENASDPLTLVSELGLRGEKGLPPLKPSGLSSPSTIGRLVLKMKRGSSASGPLKAAMEVESGAYVIMVDDLGLHPREIIKAAGVLERKGSKAVLLYPNPVFFVSKEGLTERELETLYRGYRERKEVMRKVRGWIKVIEVGPRDVLPRVVGRL
ncbi:DUF58 domain-containing protein [Thermococcus sp. GR6]|uniref:DUF58 domain-containing protein n=1 Tax=Thermococcus sp. GR6 TaxID=1638256 RepID=UPI00142FF3D3|nr:DUF58 domain-containing protein [Thermococcus sp. GR6]NJE42923.1 DUF58 domain-containing protein [Thermococcus sp. GR6]